MIPAPPDPVRPTWLERNWLHVGAWVAGCLAVGIGFFDVEWGRQLAREWDSALIVGGLAAFGGSAAFAAGVKVPAP